MIFIDNGVSKDGVIIHSISFKCANCLKGYRHLSKSSDTADWIMCGIRNFCSEDDTSHIQEFVISKVFREKPTMEQQMDFLERYYTYNVISKPRKECPF